MHDVSIFYFFYLYKTLLPNSHMVQWSRSWFSPRRPMFDSLYGKVGSSLLPSSNSPHIFLRQKPLLASSRARVTWWAKVVSPHPCAFDSSAGTVEDCWWSVWQSLGCWLETGYFATIFWGPGFSKRHEELDITVCHWGAKERSLTGKRIRTAMVRAPDPNH